MTRNCISFIIPAYNCEKTVTEAVDSIFNGNFSSGDEVVIVDDASTDKTLTTLRKLQLKYKHIKVVKHSFNKGGGATRNTAIENSNNDLIFCLDSDNILVPRSILILKKFHIKKNSEITSFQKIQYFERNITNKKHSWEYKHSIYNSDNYLMDCIVPGASGNYLFTKKSWYLAGKYPENVKALDAWGFGLSQVMSGSNMVVMPNSFYYHRIGLVSYWQRSLKDDNPSILALSLVLRYYSRLNKSDLNRIMSQQYRLKWFDMLGTKIMIRGQVHQAHLKSGIISNIIEKIWQ